MNVGRGLYYLVAGVLVAAGLLAPATGFIRGALAAAGAALVALGVAVEAALRYPKR